MSSISFGGGLDVNSIVSRLLFIERAPGRTLESARKDLAARTRALDSYESTLRLFLHDFLALARKLCEEDSALLLRSRRSRIWGFRSAIEPLRETAALNARSASSSNAAILKATAGNGDASGTFNFTVTALASTHSLASAGLGSRNDLVSGGTFDITVGDDQTVSITVGAGAALEHLRDSINTSDANVNAVLFLDGSDYGLTVTSGESGTAGAVTVDNFSTTDLQDALAFSQSSAATDAAFKVNGLDLTRSSNTVSDVLDGVALSLRAIGSSTVSLETDSAEVSEKICELVDSYNKLTNLVKSQLTSADGSPGPIAQMTSIGRLQEQMRNLISRSIPGLEGECASLRQLGIELQNDGTIVLDESKLSDAIAAGRTSTDIDPGGTLVGAVKLSFAVAESFGRMLDDALGSNGTLKTERNGLKNSDTLLQDRIESIDRRLEKREAFLVAQMTRADMALQQIHSLIQSINA